MEILDAQIHVYERNHPGRPWVTDPGWLHAEVTGEQSVAAMDAIGVDGAILVSTFLTYRYDPSYALEVHARYPERFRLVRPVDPEDPAVEECIADWSRTPGAVGVRIVLLDGVSDPPEADLDRTLACAARHGLPVNLFCWGRLPQVAGLAARHPDTALVVDHLGISQPGIPQTDAQPGPADPFAELPALLALAPHANVSVKVSGACSLSRQPFPYDDLWEPLERVFDAFGIGRCMWGTDWTRTAHQLSYEQALRAFLATDRLSEGDRAELMAGTLKRIYRW